MKLLTTFQLRTAAIIIAFAFLIAAVTRLNSQLIQCQTDSYFVSGGDIAKAQFIDSIMRSNDSIRMEVFPLETQLGRYEVALSILRDRNPNAAKQYEEIISNETE